MDSDLVPRVGTFLILAGIGLLMVFITYELGGTAHFDFLLISLLLIFIGIRLKLSGRSDSPGARFKSVRRISEKHKQKKDQNSTPNKNHQD
jgi:hypothetical protein